MNRIRTVKPEWLEDERLALASSDARVLSIALILLSDDYGNGRAAPVQLAGRVFPGKVLETLAKALEELVNVRYVRLYSIDGQRYYSIRNWAKHQRVDKPGKPQVPGPPEEDPRESSRESRESSCLARVRSDQDQDQDQEGKGGETRGDARPPSVPPPSMSEAVRAADLAPGPARVIAFPANDQTPQQPTTASHMQTFRDVFAAEAFALDWCPAPEVTHSHLRQAVTRAAEYATAKRIPFEEAARALARTALQEARSTSKGVGFVLLECEPGRPRQARAGRIAISKGTTGKDFEDEPDFEVQMAQLRAEGRL